VKAKEPNKMPQRSINIKDVLGYYNFMYCSNILTKELTYKVINWILEHIKTAPPCAKAKYSPSIKQSIRLITTLYKNINNSYEFINAITVTHTKWVVVLTAWFIAQTFEVEKLMEYAESKKEVLFDREYLSVCNACKVAYQLQKISGIEELDSDIEFV